MKLETPKTPDIKAIKAAYRQELKAYEERKEILNSLNLSAEEVYAIHGPSEYTAKRGEGYHVCLRDFDDVLIAIAFIDTFNHLDIVHLKGTFTSFVPVVPESAAFIEKEGVIKATLKTYAKLERLNCFNSVSTSYTTTITCFVEVPGISSGAVKITAETRNPQYLCHKGQFKTKHNRIVWKGEGILDSEGLFPNGIVQFASGSDENPGKVIVY